MCAGEQGSVAAGCAVQGAEETREPRCAHTALRVVQSSCAPLALVLQAAEVLATLPCLPSLISGTLLGAWRTGHAWPVRMQASGAPAHSHRHCASGWLMAVLFVCLFGTRRRKAK